MTRNVIDYLNRIVNICPDKTAYSDGSVSLSFRQVYDQSRALASFLAGKGIYKKPVVIYMQKSPAEVAAFFGTVTAGNYYVPVDDTMPFDKIRMILDNVKSPLILCDDKTIGDARSQGLDKEAEVVLYSGTLDTPADDKVLSDIREKALDTDPIYIVFTSGSTGTPKGVCACHRSVIDYLEVLTDVLKIDENTVFGSQTPLFVDACLKELYPTLMFGATTYLIPKYLFATPVPLVEYMNRYKINTVCWVVTALKMISALGALDEVRPEYLHTIAFGSEVFPLREFRKWRKACPDAEFINLYGPTEATGMTCYYRVDRDFEDGEPIPIGRPFPNREVLLFKEDMTLAGAGEEGEICIRGNALTLGYYNDPVKTKESFVQNPLNPFYPELIYKTGDIGRMNERGELVFVSRKDYQIKRNGYRIELGEVEANVEKLPEITSAVCIWDNDKNRLVLYYVGNVEERPLKKILTEKLSDYMIPNRIVRLDKIPQTPNGKIDRAGLKKLYLSKRK